MFLTPKNDFGQRKNWLQMVPLLCQPKLSNMAKSADVWHFPVLLLLLAHLYLEYYFHVSGLLNWEQPTLLWQQQYFVIEDSIQIAKWLNLKRIEILKWYLHLDASFHLMMWLSDYHVPIHWQIYASMPYPCISDSVFL